MALGVLFIVSATFALLDDKVDCGGETMSEGQVCVRENRSGTVVSEDSLAETRTSETVGGVIGIGFGLLVIVIGAQNLRIGLRNRATAQAAPAQPGPQGPQQPHPYYQQAPHQGWHPQPPQRH